MPHNNLGLPHNSIAKTRTEKVTEPVDFVNISNSEVVIQIEGWGLVAEVKLEVARGGDHSEKRWLCVILKIIIKKTIGISNTNGINLIQQKGLNWCILKNLRTKLNIIRLKYVCCPHKYENILNSLQKI